MRTIFLLSLALSAIGADSSRCGQVCRCTSAPTAQQGLAGADAVFLGHATTIHRATGNLFGKPSVVSFTVMQSWKGSQSRTITVQTGTGGGDCGFVFVKDSAYLVYANLHNGVLETSTCTRTALASAAMQDIAVLGSVRPVQE
jgi:hypothetical protein